MAACEFAVFIQLFAVHCRTLITVSTLVQLKVIQTLLLLRAPATDFCTFSLLHSIFNYIE